MSALARCPFGDLPVYSCACPRCRPDVGPVYAAMELTVIEGGGVRLDEPDEAVRVVTRFWADQSTKCDGCGEKVVVGEPLAKLSDGDVVGECCIPGAVRRSQI